MYQRYTATSILLAKLLMESFKPDSDSEREICNRVLELLNDQYPEVQGLAVKWCARTRCMTFTVPSVRPPRRVHEPRRSLRHVALLRTRAVPALAAWCR